MSVWVYNKSSLLVNILQFKIHPDSSCPKQPTEVIHTVDVISSIVEVPSTGTTSPPPTPSESVITYSTDSHLLPSQSMTLRGTVHVTTKPIKVVQDTGTESINIVLIAGIVAGTFVGLIILILAIVIAVWSFFFKCHCPLKINPNKLIELVQYQNAVGEAAVDGDDENCSNDSPFFEPEYQHTADEPNQNVDSCTEHFPNPVYTSSVTKGLYESVPTENTCGGDNTHVAIPNEPTPLLPKQHLDQLGKAKTNFDHALPIYSEVQKNTP